jgi:D-cysteine desulfhydrase family pyridoxal phosphate-dependent enzyme
MGEIETKLAGRERINHALLPTPVHELVALSEASGYRVFCKRDDLTGFGFGGNKARKLDFLVAEALAAGCDTLLAVGANQSNFCRIVAAYGAAHGMDVHLVLGGGKPAAPTGNLLLDDMLGAQCHHVDSADWSAWEGATGELEEVLKCQGRAVYRMPIGGSTPVGALGYVAAMAEIMEDERRLGTPFSSIVFATASAGTQAGLVVGKSMARWPGQVLGFSVAKEAPVQQEDVFTLARATAATLGGVVERETVVVDDAYLGQGYGQRTRECEEAVTLFARTCGIFLDHVYTGKAAAGLLGYLRARRFAPGSAILFIHTGGSPELFA